MHLFVEIFYLCFMISVNKTTISIESHRITSTDRQNKQWEYHITSSGTLAFDTNIPNVEVIVF